jgi:hypothetical protein
MNEIWVLIIKTSLPNVAVISKDMKTSIVGFDSFEKARNAFREKIKEFAFSDNSMFDGKGQIKNFSEYVDGMTDEIDDEYDDEIDDEALTSKKLSAIQGALKKAFSGDNVKLKIPDGTYTDWMIAVDVEAGSVEFYGDDDGPDNGYNPTLKTNIFSMEKEQDYYLYVNDIFGQNDASSELYIDLKKVSIQ